MTEKFVRDCDNVKDITKVDFIMARQSDLIHTTDGKEWVMNNGKPEQISGAVTRSYLTNSGSIVLQATDSKGGGGIVGQLHYNETDFTVKHDSSDNSKYNIELKSKDSDWMELTLINGFSKADADSRARVRTRNNQEYLELDLYDIKCPAIAANTGIAFAVLPDTITFVLKTANLTAINWTNLTHVSVNPAGTDSQTKPYIRVRTTSAVTADQLIAINFTVPIK